MIVVKRAVLLLLPLLLAVIGTDAAPGPGHCGVLNKTLPTKDFHKIFGDWVLVWSVSDYLLGSYVLGNLSSSHVELQLLPDNKTIMYNERNLLLDKPCTQYFINMSMPSDPSDSDHHTLHTEAAMVEKEGVVQPYNDSGDVDFYESCSDCLVMVYREKDFQFLLIYRREGHHQDVEQLKAAHSDHKKLAECLGFPHDRPFSYDGVAGQHIATVTCNKGCFLPDRPTKETLCWTLIRSAEEQQKHPDCARPGPEGSAGD